MYNRPIYPGAMTPAQMFNRILNAAAAVIITAAGVAAMFTMFILFN